MQTSNTIYSEIVSSKKPQKTLNLSDILFGSIFILIFCLLIYWFCERLGIVPIINIQESDTFALSIFGVNHFSMNYGELVISMILIIESTWIIGWVLWFKIRKYEIQW